MLSPLSGLDKRGGGGRGLGEDSPPSVWPRCLKLPVEQSASDIDGKRVSNHCGDDRKSAPGCRDDHRIEAAAQEIDRSERGGRGGFSCPSSFYSSSSCSSSSSLLPPSFLPPMPPSLLPALPPPIPPTSSTPSALPPCTSGCSCASLLPRLFASLASLGHRLDALERRRERRRKRRKRKRGGSAPFSPSPAPPASSGSAPFLPISSSSSFSTSSFSSSSDCDESFSPAPSSKSDHSGHRRRRRQEAELRRRKRRRKEEEEVTNEKKGGEEEEEEEEDCGRFVGRMEVLFEGGGAKEEEGAEPKRLMLRNFRGKRKRKRKEEEGGGLSSFEQSRGSLLLPAVFGQSAAVAGRNGTANHLLLIHSSSPSSQHALHLLQSPPSFASTGQSHPFPLSSLGQWRFSDFSPSRSLPSSSNHATFFRLWLHPSSSRSPAPLLRLSPVVTEMLLQGGGACGRPLPPLRDMTAPPGLGNDH
ncbi:MAP7 domain-containing protein 1-like, partial [Centroberyx affinis]|uniref:MAP7 domain-containing protein 1-like n=1 Tax=Centroberyx affinis TaxID=166261 RepID=UPI003A5B9C5C